MLSEKNLQIQSRYNYAFININSIPKLELVSTINDVNYVATGNFHIFIIIMYQFSKRFGVLVGIFGGFLDILLNFLVVLVFVRIFQQIDGHLPNL